MKEWRKIKEYEGYEVSNYGEVRTLGLKQEYSDGRVIGKPSKLLKPNAANNGYYNVFLYKNTKKKGYGIHRLVAQAFIPNPDNLPQVNHINGNKHDNRVENLEWCNASYNQLHAVKKGLVKVHKVEQYDLSGKYIKTWDSIKEITKTFKVSHTLFVKCCNNKIDSAYGYKWQYKEA